jgi:V/A-type H+-transporting ATPase subunit E
MADELQALLDRIDEEGLKKAEAKKSALLTQAQKEADAIVADAREQAEKIISDAGREAELLRQKSEQALRQASRDVLLEVRAVLTERVQQAVGELLRHSLDAKDLGAIVAQLCTAYLQNQGTENNIEVLLGAEQFSALEAAVKAQLAADLQKNCVLTPAKEISGGFKLVFSGQDVLYDFTDQALAEAIALHLSPRIAGIITDQG